MDLASSLLYRDAMSGIFQVSVVGFMRVAT